MVNIKNIVTSHNNEEVNTEDVYTNEELPMQNTKLDCHHIHEGEACHEHHSHHSCQSFHNANKVSTKTPSCYNRAKNIKKKRKVAKIGLATSLALLTVTGFTKVIVPSKKIHAVAGIAMLVFSCWHASLYKNPHAKKDRIKPQPDKVQEV